MTDEMSNVDTLVKQWDDYLETDRSFLEGFLLAQQMRDRIEALTAERDEYKRSATHSEDVVRAARAEIERLREALKPFANYAKSLKGWEPTEAVCSEIGLDFERVVTAGDFFAARAALKGQQP